jgi:myo-inositol-1(or 4)-monophosphatase
LVDYCHSKGTEAESSFDLGIETKSGAADFATQVDVDNEKMVIKGILAKFPTHEIIGEESVGTGEVPPLTMAPTWVIDPIDGTTNFAAGIPLTCVSIALCVDQRPVLGVVYAPMTQELYLAVKGHGAYRNGVKIIPRGHTPMNNAVVCCEFGYPRDTLAIAKMVGAVQRILQCGCRAIRQLGSGVLDLCYVATGRLDVVYAGVASEGWKPWDYAAGLVILQEAGCVIEAIDQPSTQKEFDLYSKSLICAVSQELLQDCRQIITASN